jgi:Ca2+-binding EF-hand superfamily protein
MSLSTRAAVACFAVLLCAPIASTQESKDQPPSEEDVKFARIIERWIQAHETEREHVLREVARISNGKTDDDFEHWFAHLGGDENGWDRSRIQRMYSAEIFDRIAARMRLAGPVLSRSQFVDHAKQYWAKDKSPLWREPPAFQTNEEAERLFRYLDRDRDGYLSMAEMAPALRSELKRWDKNGDGWINLDEYRPYFAHRLDRIYRDAQQRSDKPLPVLELTLPEDERPMVIRAGKLPLGLPAWFEQLDTDHDGQIALSEWFKAGWPLEEFKKLDSNGDGLLEPGEILKLLAITERDGSRPYAYLMQKRIDTKSK